MARKETGERLYASDVNELADGVRKINNTRGAGVTNGPAGVAFRADVEPALIREPAISVPAINAGTVDLLMYAPCTIRGNLYTGAKGESERVLKVATPAAGEEGLFAICAEPIKAPVSGRPGRVGRVYVAGVCAVRLKNPNSLDFADIEAGANYLLGASSGGAQILGEEAFVGSAIHIGYVRFPRGGGDTVYVARVASTAALGALNGAQTVDGVVLANNDIIFLWHQGASNGLWRVNTAGDWTFIAQPAAVDVKAGTLYGRLRFLLTSTNTYQPMGSVWM